MALDQETFQLLKDSVQRFVRERLTGLAGERRGLRHPQGAHGVGADREDQQYLQDLLRHLSISYVIAGQDKLATLLGMQRVIMGDGDVLSWTYLQDRLVDKLSILMVPVINATPQTHGLFTAKEPLTSVQPRSFSLISVQPMKDSTVWLRYRANKG